MSYSYICITYCFVRNGYIFILSAMYRIASWVGRMLQTLTEILVTHYLGRFLWGTFFFLLQTQFLCFQVSYCPAKRGNRASSSRNEFDYSWRGTQAVFPLLDCRSCENFGLAHFSIFLLEKKSDQSPHFDQLSVF